MDINGIPFKQGEMKIGTLGVQKGESVEKSNEDSSVEYKEGRKGLFGSSGSLKTVDVDRSEQSYLKANMEQLMDEAKEYSKNVDMTNISQALFVAQDLSETGDEAAQKKAGDITKNAKNCIENSENFTGVKIHDGQPDELSGKLNSTQTKEYLDSDKGKATLNEIGLTNSNDENNKQQYFINGKPCDVELSEDGILRASYIENKNGEEAARAVDFQLSDKDIPKAEKESSNYESAMKYEVDGSVVDENGITGIKAEEHLKEQGIDVDLFKDSIQQLIRNEAFEKTGEIILQQDFGTTEIGRKLEKLMGAELKDLPLNAFHNNQIHYTDDNGVEHQFYYDKKSGDFIEAQVKKNEETGNYDVDLLLPKGTEGNGNSKSQEPSDSQPSSKILFDFEPPNEPSRRWDV